MSLHSTTGGGGCQGFQPSFFQGYSGYPVSMEVFVLLLLLAALVCFILAALRIAVRLELVALGLAFWVSTAVISAINAL